MVLQQTRMGEGFFILGNTPHPSLRRQHRAALSRRGRGHNDDDCAVRHFAFSRGMISRAMSSICSASYLWGTKMIFCVPTATCALSCSTHSSTVPMMALSLVDSLHDAKSHSLVSHSIMRLSTACRDLPMKIGSCAALRSLSGSFPASLAKPRILFHDLAKLSGR